jgi:hypothetical protein
MPSDTYIKAGRKDTPPEELARLAEHPDSDVRWHVAINPCTPLDVLIKLATDCNWLVRYRVIYHPNVPVEALLILMKDKDALLRKSALERI